MVLGFTFVSNRRILALAAGAMIAALAGAALLIHSPDRIPAIPGSDDAATVALGARLYAAHCASCHGATLEGQADWRQRKADGRLPAPPHDASGHTWHHSDEVLFRITRDGMGPFAPPGYQSDMPGFGNVLSTDEIAAVLAFIKSTWPADTRRRQAAIGQGQP